MSSRRPPEGLAHTTLHHVLAAYEDPAIRGPAQALLRSSLTHPAAREPHSTTAGRPRCATTPLARARGRPLGVVALLSSLAVANLVRGAFADMLAHALAAASLAVRPTMDLAVAALGAIYAGDLDQARTLNTRMVASAESPTHRGDAAYVAGEIENAAGRPDRAEQPYATAIDLGRLAVPRSSSASRPPGWSPRRPRLVGSTMRCATTAK